MLAEPHEIGEPPNLAACPFVLNPLVAWSAPAWQPAGALPEPACLGGAGTARAALDSRACCAAQGSLHGQQLAELLAELQRIEGQQVVLHNAVDQNKAIVVHPRAEVRQLAPPKHMQPASAL